MAFAPPRAADPPGEVLGRSYSAKAVQVVASVSPPDRDHSGPRFPELIVCGNGSGSSSLLDRLLHRRLLSVGAPRTSKRPVRCRVADRRLVSPRAGTSDGSETLRINELTNARAELERRRTDPHFKPSEVQVTVHSDMAVPALDFVDVSSKALAGRSIILGHYLESKQAPIVLVVVSALEELVNDPPLMRQVLHQLQLHTASHAQAQHTSHAQAQHKVYLVLSKIDKVIEEDVPAKILDRLLAGLLPAADGVSAETSEGLTAEPCLAAFDGIFAVVSGHPSREPGPELAAYEATKLESILEFARGHAEYAPHMAALQSRLGVGALWEHIVGQDLDQHSLRWLQDEQVPKLRQRREDVVAEIDALPIKQPSMQAVLDDVLAKVDQDALTFVFPFFGVGTIASCASSMVVNFSVVRSIYMVRKLLEDHHFGRQGTAAWASVSPKLRNALQDCCSSPNIIKMAKDAMRQAITGAFQQPSPAADHLCISRFTALLAKLTVPVLSAVMHEEHEEHGKYMDTVLQHLMLQWHLPGGPAQVCANLQDAMLDLARESAARCLPKVLHPNSVLDFDIQEDEASATHRAALISKACSLHEAIRRASEIEAQFKQPRAQAEPEDSLTSAPEADAVPAAEPQPGPDAAHSPSALGAEQLAAGQPPAEAPAEGEISSAVAQAPLVTTPTANAAVAVAAAAEDEDDASPSTPEAVQQMLEVQEAPLAPNEEDAASVATSSGPSEEPEWQVLQL